MGRLRQLLRYAAVSLVATGISQMVLGVLVWTRATPAVWANVIATLAGVGPSFELNRRWVWGTTGRRSMAREVVPFVALSATGLALSTLAVAIASHWADAHHLAAGVRTLTVQGANLFAFGVVWVVQFVLLDRVLFRRHRGATTPRATMSAA
jgi:putative flippase GtrA